MKIKKYAKSEYCYITHAGFKAYMTVVERGDGSREAQSFSIPNLTYSVITSQQLSERVARAYGEIFLKVADMLSNKK